MKINPHQIIPTAYSGREQAYIKHLLLEGYLERLLYIVGFNASILGHSEIVFVDCFAGPWQDETEDLTSTSISISIRLLSKIQSDLEKVNKPIKFRALYIERDKKSFSRLISFLSEKTPKNIQSDAIHGDFSESISTILSKLKTTSFAFFFIDPKGWSQIKPSLLQPLLARPRSEYLVNFMYNFVNRAVSIDSLRSDMIEIFGDNIDKLDIPTDPEQRERFLIEKYRHEMELKSKFSNIKTLSAYVTILDPLINRTKYHLLYLTRHPKGIVEFMTQSEKLSKIQNTVRIAAKIHERNKNFQIDDFFGIDTSNEHTVSSPEDLDRITRLANLWMSHIEEQPLKVNEEFFAHLLSTSNCFPSELQRAVEILISKGLIVNLDANVSKRKANFVNYKKSERLQKLN